MSCGPASSRSLAIGGRGVPNSILRVSSLVLLECGAGDSDAAALRLTALDGVSVLAQSPEAETLADTLLREVPLPAKAAADALQHCSCGSEWGVVPFDVELHAYRQCDIAAENRSGVSSLGLRAAGHLYAEGTPRRRRCVMSNGDVLAELRAWRDEFAKSHGYDIHEMAAALRALDIAAGQKLIRGEPRSPVAARMPTEPLQPTGAALPVSLSEKPLEAAPADS
jgi:hypothetical protein